MTSIASTPISCRILLKWREPRAWAAGEDVENAIIEAASWLSAVPLGRVAKGIAACSPGTTAGRFIDSVEKLIKARNAQHAGGRRRS